MDEFRKSFEYFEEKGVGGILLILFLMLISLEPFIGILSAAAGYNAFPDSKVFTLILISAAVYILLALFSGIVLKKLRSYAVAAIKVFLVYRMVFLAPILIINMRFQIGTIPYAKTFSQYSIEYNSAISSFAVSIAYAVIFSIGWYIYLNQSKKVHELFPPRKSDIKLTQ